MFGHICFVANQHEHGIGISVAFDLIDPVVFDVHERVAIGEIEDEEEGM